MTRESEHRPVLWLLQSNGIHTFLDLLGMKGDHCCVGGTVKYIICLYKHASWYQMNFYRSTATALDRRRLILSSVKLFT